MKAFSILTVLGVLLALAAGTTGSALAAGNTQQYGPYASTSPDSGTCGNLWATETFDRVFRVSTQPNADGTYTLVEEFKNGSFVTGAGPSPGGCETNPGGVVSAGVTGKMHGTFTIVVSGGTFDPTGGCPGDCTTADFIATHFGAGATYDVPTYEFHYSAGNNGEWKNASADRGGDHGDITGAP
jgi:hypothetical protein